MKEPKPFIIHIIESIDHISDYIQNVDFNQFESDRKTQSAVIRELEIIGEASTHLEEEFTQSHPQIPWRAIKDFRNRLIHEYWYLDLDIIWRVATKRCPKLKQQLQPILKSLESSSKE